jgi:nitrite reductase/ring-hydroxylating ferredoxin subunit
MIGDSQQSIQMECRPGLIRIGVAGDLPGCGEVKEVAIGGRLVCIANIDGNIYATDNVCPHWGGPLGQGKIREGKLVCPWHGWTFDLKTGETTRSPRVKLTRHTVVIHGEEVFLEFQDNRESLSCDAAPAQPR